MQGRYGNAVQACDRLIRWAPLAIGVTCRADIAALTGGAAESARQLRRLLAARGAVPEEVRLWALGVLAEAAAHAGDVAAAEAAYREALALGRRDVYLLAAWADFLLDQGRPDEVRRLLREDTRADPLLLRLVIAERMLDDPAWVGGHDTLRRRITAGRARGDASHLREEARVALALDDDRSAALQLALDNWRVQREPVDARLVLQAAFPAGQPAAARGVLDFLAATGMEDPTLADLARRLADAGA